MSNLLHHRPPGMEQTYNLTLSLIWLISERGAYTCEIQRDFSENPLLTSRMLLLFVDSGECWRVRLAVHMYT